MKPEDWKKKRDVIRHYDRIAKVYDSLYSDEQNLKIKAALDAVQVGNSDSVLDLGCGTGFLIDHLGDTARFVVGVDISRGLLKEAADRSRRLGGKSAICLVHADADYLPFQKESFNKVFAFTLLQNVCDPVLALREMVRVAKSDSTIAVSGLKKSFPRDAFEGILIKAGLDLSLVNSGGRTQDFVAVCRKDRTSLGGKNVQS